MSRPCFNLTFVQGKHQLLYALCSLPYMGSKVQFLSRFDHKQDIDFGHFSLKRVLVLHPSLELGMFSRKSQATFSLLSIRPSSKAIHKLRLRHLQQQQVINRVLNVQSGYKQGSENFQILNISRMMALGSEPHPIFLGYVPPSPPPPPPPPLLSLWAEFLNIIYHLSIVMSIMCKTLTITPKDIYESEI